MKREVKKKVSSVYKLWLSARHCVGPTGGTRAEKEPSPPLTVWKGGMGLMHTQEDSGCGFKMDDCFAWTWGEWGWRRLKDLPKVTWLELSQPRLADSRTCAVNWHRYAEASTVRLFGTPAIQVEGLGWASRCWGRVRVRFWEAVCVVANGQAREPNCLALNPSPALTFARCTVLGKLFNLNASVSLFVKWE